MFLDKIAYFAIRNHFFGLTIWIVVQFLVGLLVSQSNQLGIVGPSQLNAFGRDFTIPSPETLMAFHEFSGTGLAATCAALFLVKIYSVLRGLKRPKIPNTFVSLHVRYHYIAVSALIIFQWFLMGPYGEQTQRIIGFTRETTQLAHRWHSYAIVASAITLFFEKIYLLIVLAPKEKAN